MSILGELLRVYQQERLNLDTETRRNMADAIQSLATNAVDANWRTKLASAVSGGYDYADTMHNIFLDYGYPETISFFQFWNMYRRFGIAKNVVELPIDYGWLDVPTVVADSKIQNVIKNLEKRVDLWNRIRGLDLRQRVGRYAGLFMRIRDGKDPREPIQGTVAGDGALVQLVPYYEGQLKVLTTDSDPTSDTFGLPTMYQYNGAGTGDRNEKAATSFQIHPDRIIIGAEGADNGDIYGIPALEACYNSLMDLRKIIGGGAEGFYKNASQSVVFGIKDVAGIKGNEALLNDFADSYDEWSHNRMRRGMWAPGMDPTVLNSNLVASDPHFNAALNDIAAAAKVPATILIGQQTGRLASDQDNRHMLALANSRRGGDNKKGNGFQTQLVMDVFRRFQKLGILPAGSIELEWSDLLDLADSEKLDNADKMAGINQKQYLSGGAVPFGGAEIREAAGYEPEELPASTGEDLPVDTNVPPPPDTVVE